MTYIKLNLLQPGHLFILHQDIPKHHNSTDPQSELTALNLAILKTLWLPDVEIRWIKLIARARLRLILLLLFRILIVIILERQEILMAHRATICVWVFPEIQLILWMVPEPLLFIYTWICSTQGDTSFYILLKLKVQINLPAGSELQSNHW